ncbi:MAG: hypothetical protein ACYCOY_07985 [Metallibacterium sp.]
MDMMISRVVEVLADGSTPIRLKESERKSVQGLRPAQPCYWFLIIGFVVVLADTQLWVPIAHANQLLMVPMNEPEGLAVTVPGAGQCRSRRQGAAQNHRQC